MYDVYESPPPGHVRYDTFRIVATTRPLRPIATEFREIYAKSTEVTSEHRDRRSSHNIAKDTALISQAVHNLR